MQSQNPSYTNQVKASRIQGCQDCPPPAQKGKTTSEEDVLTVRNRYFTGKFLTARDLGNEQGYFLSRERMHNRLLHGWGIVCGLQVIQHPSRTCTDSVVVTPGVAIDCEGREIILEEEMAVRVWTADDLRNFQSAMAGAQAQGAGNPSVASAQQPAQSTLQGQAEQQSRPKRPRFGPFLIVVSYAEQPIERVQALYTETTCDPRELESNRVREVPCFSVIPWDDENQTHYAGCWPVRERRPEVNCEPGCCQDPVTVLDPLTGQVIPPCQTGCLEPVCACLPGVPLALIYPDKTNGGADPYGMGDHSINVRGRREMETPPQYLTHIVKTNWTHGGAMSLDQLIQKGELRITFDRQLMSRSSKRHHSGLGINQHTFQVQYHRERKEGRREREEGSREREEQRRRDRDEERRREREWEDRYPIYMLYDDERKPYFDADTCEAVFPIDKELLTGRSTLRGTILYISLKCDFILDCQSRPVDGQHMRGRLPSGDSSAGGTFESWFRVVGRDEDCREYEEEDEEEDFLEDLLWEWIEREQRWLHHERRELVEHEYHEELREREEHWEHDYDHDKDRDHDRDHDHDHDHDHDRDRGRRGEAREGGREKPREGSRDRMQDREEPRGRESERGRERYEAEEREPGGDRGREGEGEGRRRDAGDNKDREGGREYRDRDTRMPDRDIDKEPSDDDDEEDKDEEAYL